MVQWLERWWRGEARAEPLVSMSSLGIGGLGGFLHGDMTVAACR